MVSLYYPFKTTVLSTGLPPYTGITSYSSKFKIGIYWSTEGWFYGEYCRTGTVTLKRDIYSSSRGQLQSAHTFMVSYEIGTEENVRENTDPMTNPSGSGFDI
jgi:hypothetical protein